MRCRRVRNAKLCGVFESWKNERANDNGSAELCKFGLDVSAVQNLKTGMLNMTADTLNF